MGPTLARRAGRPPVVVRPVPPCEPPFDDELPAPQAWAPGFQQLALRWPPPGARPDPASDGCDHTPAGPDSRPRGPQSRSGAPTASARGGSDTPPAEPARAAYGRVPDGRVAAGRFVTRCVEILNGFRPVEHARPMVDGARERAVLAQLAIGRQRVADLLEGARPGPVPDPRRPRGAARALPVTLLRLHAGEPAPGALEAAAVLRTADRAWALAFRLEYRGGGWRCTAAWTL